MNTETDTQARYQANIVRWTHWHAALMLLSIALVLAGLPLYLIPVTATLSLIVYGVRFIPGDDAESCNTGSRDTGSRGTGRLGIGYANLVTLVRGLIAAIVFVLFTELPSLLAAGLLLLVLLLDGVDGYVARLRGESSVAGQYLDVETDALLVAYLCVLLWAYAEVSAAILVIGSLRYLYLLFLAAFVRHERLEPKRRYATVIAVATTLVLIIRLVYPSNVTDALLLLVCLAMLLSFSRSLFHQISFTR